MCAAPAIVANSAVQAGAVANSCLPEHNLQGGGWLSIRCSMLLQAHVDDVGPSLADRTVSPHKPMQIIQLLTVQG